MLAARRRRARTATGRRRGGDGGGREGGREEGGPGYSLSQDSRLSPSASAILQLPSPALHRQTSRGCARAGRGRSLHGGLKARSAAVPRRAGVCRIPRGREYSFASSSVETPDVNPTLGQSVQGFIRVLSLRRALGSPPRSLYRPRWPPPHCRQRVGGRGWP